MSVMSVCLLCLSVCDAVCLSSVCLSVCLSLHPPSSLPPPSKSNTPLPCLPPGSRYEPSLAASVADADLVVEAIVENLDIKQAVFAEVRGRWGETEGGLMELPGGCFRLHDYWAGSQVVRSSNEGVSFVFCFVFFSMCLPSGDHTVTRFRRLTRTRRPTRCLRRTPRRLPLATSLGTRAPARFSVSTSSTRYPLGSLVVCLAIRVVG